MHLHHASAFLRRSLRRTSLVLGAAAIAAAADDGAGSAVAKLAAQVRLQIQASRVKAQPAARPAQPASLRFDGTVPKLVAHARLRAGAAAAKTPLPVVDARADRLAGRLAKLRGLALQREAQALRKPGALPVPTRKAAAVQQDTLAHLTYGDGVDGALTAQFEDVVYTFTGVAGDVVDIALNSDAFDAYLVLALDGEVIASDDDSGGDLNSLISGFVLPASGAYAITVRSFSGDTGDFVLSLSSTGSAIAFAGSITAGTVSSQLRAAGQLELYHLAVDELSLVTVTLSSTDFDAYLRLYAGSGPADRTDANLIDENDDGAGSLNSRLELTLQAGDYLIEAGSFSGRGGGAFDLAVAVTPQGSDEDAGGPAALTGQVVSGSLLPAGDEDTYRFAGNAGDVVDLSLDSDDFDPVLTLELDGQAIGYDDDGGGNRNSLLADFVLPASGDFVVRVASYGSAGSGAYTLGVAAAASPFVFYGQTGAGTYPGLLAAGGVHLYAVTLAAPAVLVADLMSDEFDAFMVLYAGSDVADRNPDNRIGLDDDGGEGLDAHLELSLAPGTYLVEARSFSSQASGAYDLTLGLTDQNLDEDGTGPVALGAGDALAGAIFPAGDSDAFTFTGDAGDVVEIAVTSADFDAVLYVDLGDSTVAFDDDSGGSFNPLLAAFVLPVSGDYTLRVLPYRGDAVGAYQLTLTDVTPPVAVFDALAVGTVVGAIDASGQVDLYPLVLAGPAQVLLDLSSADFDAFLSLYAGAGAGDRRDESLIAADDDGGVGLDSRLLLVLDAGSYLVAARPLSGFALGAYQLSLAVTSLAGDEDADGPVAVALGDTVRAALSPARDEDRFRFSGAAGAVVDLSAASDSIDAFLELRLDGGLLASDDDSGVDLDALLSGFVLPRTATYELRVRDAGGRGTGPYTLVLADRTPTRALRSPLAAGLVSGTLTTGGEVHVYPLDIDAASTVELSLVSSAFDAVLDLYRGTSAADLLEANRVAATNAALTLALRPGSYLVVAHAAASSGTGPYGLQLKTTVLPPTRSMLAVLSGSLNDTDVNPLDPDVSVSPGTKITGTLRLELVNPNASAVVFPVGATPTWGERRTGYWPVSAWAPSGRSQLDVAVDLTAPDEPGTFYILLAGAAEPTVADVLSGTHATSSADERWDDDDDVAAWSQTQIAAAMADGWAAVTWYSGYSADVAAAAVRVEVVAATAVAQGPVAIDFDQAPGDQGQRRAVTSGAGDRVVLQLHATDLPEISGWSVALRYDPEQVAYVGGSFTASDLLPGLVALVIANEAVLEVGGTLLGSTATVTGDGLLGTLAFDVLDGFQFSADLTVELVSLRTPSGRIKQEVTSRAVVSAPTGHPAGPIAIDLDPAAGDQGVRRLDRLAAGQRLEVGLAVADAPEGRGWSARLEYDPQLVRYVAGSFRPGDFIAGLIPLVAEKEGRIDLGGAVLGASTTGAGAGDLGTLAFELTDAFADSAVVTITQVSFNTTASGEVITVVRNPVVLAAASSAIAGDFSNDGHVDFTDFFRFADHFGLSRDDAAWDPLYDLDDDGEVNFSDFFRFADTFGTERAKLIALAVERLGLPWTAFVEQNAPNPFNATTAIDVHLLRAAPLVLEIYDVTGQRVRQLREGVQPPGSYRVEWDGRDESGAPASSGVYLYRLAVPAGDDRLGAGTEPPRKMLLLR